MTEKVIFEYKADQDQGENWMGFGFCMDGVSAFERSSWDCCHPGDHIGFHSGKRSKRPGSRRRKSGSNISETLDFFEKMYSVLYGKEDN